MSIMSEDGNIWPVVPQQTDGCVPAPSSRGRCALTFESITVQTQETDFFKVAGADLVLCITYKCALDWLRFQFRR